MTTLESPIRLPLPSRRHWLLSATLGGCAVLPALAQPQPAAAAPTRRAVELTFLRALPGQRERLAQFIVANWFEMDRIAKLQGLMDDYRLLDSGTDDDDWHALMVVTYHDERGYPGIAEAFERIRRAHTTVRIDGKGLRELGSIILSRRTLELAPGR
ncbi:MAG: hypothetical protein LW768_02565 [Rubrivivax sp.]|jgi:hypothetical protein|nr:hypothetical protein [Rubrivivax sp.]